MTDHTGSSPTAVPTGPATLTPEVRHALYVLHDAEAAHAASERATAALQALLEQALRHAIQPGDVIDQRQPQPALLRSFLTTRGNDRNTRVFEIASAPTVEVNLAQPGLSRWRCEATPISEKTGKPMNGKASGAYHFDQRTTVELRGYVLPNGSTMGMGVDPGLTALEQIATFIATYRDGRPATTPRVAPEVPAGPVAITTSPAGPNEGSSEGPDAAFLAATAADASRVMLTDAGPVSFPANLHDTAMQEATALRHEADATPITARRAPGRRGT